MSFCEGPDLCNHLSSKKLILPPKPRTCDRPCVWTMTFAAGDARGNTSISSSHKLVARKADLICQNKEPELMRKPKLCSWSSDILSQKIIQKYSFQNLCFKGTKSRRHSVLSISRRDAAGGKKIHLFFCVNA